ncbi:microtubule-associated tumor suppressor candidate 2 isoform X1 [Dasypus novemcinctus]|uniref:microtubule-associated tumor suppressor candidate 2 isoform X1 n=1 Tax=Dasypus novemcinctus TaxID=9361 RepID=UPI00265DC01E|nr:microtubule-associated tumor suppressor candidate 2 isoform X2 [Dasypus novemcinctus]
MTLSGDDQQPENFLLIKLQLAGSPFPLSRTAQKAAPTAGSKMSVPLIPKKSCYSQLQDNRNGAKNNNEGTLSLGDTNANPVMPEEGPLEEWKTGGLAGEIENVNSSEPANSARLGKESHRLQGFGKEPQAGPTSRKEAQLPSAVFGEPRAEHTTGRGADLPQGPRGGQGPSVPGWRSAGSEASAEGAARRDAEAPQHGPQDKPARPLDGEAPRRQPPGRASSCAAAVDLLAEERAGSPSRQPLHPAPLHPAPLQPPEAPLRVSVVGEKPQKTLTDPSRRAGVHPADDTSEEKPALPPQPSTSEAREATPVEPPAEEAGDGGRGCPAPPEPALDLASASEEAPRKPQAQPGQGRQERGPGWKRARRGAGPERGAPPAEGLGRPEGDRVAALERREPCGKAQEPLSPPETTGAGSRLPDSLPCRRGSGSGSDEETGVFHLGDEDALKTAPQQGPASPGATGNQPAGKTSPSAGRKWGQMASSDFSPGDSHVAVIPGKPSDRKLFQVGEKRRMLAGGDMDGAVFLASDTSVGESKIGVPESLVHPSSSSEAAGNKTIAAPVAENRNRLEGAGETESTPARAQPLPRAPAPLPPEATVNGTHQPPPPGSGLQDLCVFGVGMGPPLAGPPPTHSGQLLATPPKVPDKNTCPSGIPKPVLTPSKDTPSLQEGMENGHIEKTEERTETKPIIMPKPKHVRPKIITYIRRSPQALGQVDTSLVPVGLPYGPPACSLPLAKEEKIAGGDLKPPAALYEKFKPDLQKPRVFSSGLVVSAIKPPGQHFTQMNDKFLQEVADGPGKEEFCSPAYTHYEVPPTFYRSAMLLKPQLGLGAMSRLPSAKSRILIASQRSSASAIHPPGPITAAASLYSSEPAADLKKVSGSNAAKSNLPKSGLRPPGYSRLPAAKLAAFGFVRSSSVSSVSSTQSESSAQADQGPPAANRAAFGNGDQPALKAPPPPKDTSKGAGRAAASAPSSVAAPRKSFLPAPKPISAPAGTKKEAQKDQDANKSTVSSPKRTAASTAKLHSPGFPKQRTAAPRNGFSPKPDPQAGEAERQFVQRLRERCEEQARQLRLLRGGLRRAICGFEAFAVSTQHFFGKNESALVKENELSVELASIRDEVALNTAKCEKLQKEKEELERRCEGQVRALRGQQQAELRALEAQLQLQFEAERARLQEEHRGQLLRIRSQHQLQVEDITASHEAALLEMENHHAAAVADLQDDHDHRVRELMSTHELEKKELEENFEKLRLSLQDQVDTLTFQSQSLRDRARRFEEALRKSTEEQLEVALAPYQHLEEDMNSLKQVLEMKNQQIHQQEKKILELEKLVEKNIILEEKIQVLQQQNEDLKARIDQNTVVTRQLSEENANLQEYVEKETQEKKRLSRTNEELLWKLQTGDPTSPVKLSPTSPIYRCSSSGSSSPARVSTTPR